MERANTLFYITRFIIYRNENRKFCEKKENFEKRKKNLKKERKINSKENKEKKIEQINNSLFFDKEFNEKKKN